jgi:peroxidase
VIISYIMGRAAMVSKAPLLVWWMLQIYLLVTARAAARDSGSSNSFKFGFYGESCPDAEKIVTSVVQAQFRSNPGIAPGVLRMHFHDCFVEGCDGSVLLDPTASNPNPEKTAFPNLTLRGFEVIDEAKRKLEAACPGIVSCADILAFAARDSVQVVSSILHESIPARASRLQQLLQLSMCSNFSYEDLQ